jgi:hypothetical protein
MFFHEKLGYDKNFCISHPPPPSFSRICSIKGEPALRVVDSKLAPIGGYLSTVKNRHKLAKVYHRVVVKGITYIFIIMIVQEPSVTCPTGEKTCCYSKDIGR